MDAMEQLRRVVIDYADRVCDDPSTCECSMGVAFRMIEEAELMERLSAAQRRSRLAMSGAIVPRRWELP